MDHPGGVIATICWIVFSALFALYVTDFSSYNKTYGSLAGMIVLLIWLWLSNITLLFGLEVNAELERRRAIDHGLPDAAPYVELRDTRKLTDEQRQELERSVAARRGQHI